MNGGEQDGSLSAFYERVRNLHLRIEKTPQATVAIRREAATIAAPLHKLKDKIASPRGAAQALHIREQLVSIQTGLHQLFEEQLNPLMGPDATEIT